MWVRRWSVLERSNNGATPVSLPTYFGICLLGPYFWRNIHGVKGGVGGVKNEPDWPVLSINKNLDEQGEGFLVFIYVQLYL